MKKLNIFQMQFILKNFLEQTQLSTSGCRKVHSSRPPGLKGREIGLYYRNKNIERRKESAPEVIRSEVKQRLETMLNNSKSFYNSISYKNFKFKPYHQISDIEQNLVEAMNVRLERNSDIDRMLQNEYREKQNQDAYENTLKFRLKLPAYKKKSEILQLIDDNQVVVISGETGMLQKLFINVG